MMPSAPKYCRILILAIALALLGGSPAQAQPAAPPPPKQYEVQIRYRIFAARNDRLAQFARMTRYLKSIGFAKDEGPEGEEEDPTQTLMTGNIRVASRQDRERLVEKFLADRHIKAILLIPAGLRLPEDAQTPVKVQLELAPVLARNRERVLADQTRAKLADLGFREAVGYDNRGHTRMVGTIPAGQLDTLLKDLRRQPAGWLAPEVPIAALRPPLRDISPVVGVEVLREPEAIAPPPKLPAPFQPPEGQEYLLKIAPDLRAVAGPEGSAKPQRLEVILRSSPAEGQTGVRRLLSRAAPHIVIEGRLGPLVTVLTSPRDAGALARLSAVSAVRFPRPAYPRLRPAELGKDDTAEALRASGLDRLHKLHRRGKGVRVAVIDADFRGYRQLVRDKGLPDTTRYLDLTAERNPEILPDEFPGDPKDTGHGTQCARAVLLAAPDADLTLVRVDPATAYMLDEVARFMNGESFRPLALEQRLSELDEIGLQLDDRRQQLIKEREAVLRKFTDASEREFLEKKPADKLTTSEQQLLKEIHRRDQYFKDQEQLERDEKDQRRRMARYLALERDLRNLRAVRVVSSSLVWDDGYLLGGASPLSRYFDDRQAQPALWFQAAGDSRGQSWSGLFRDQDGNGVMEFTPPDPRHPRDWWKTELNFLAWKAFGKDQRPELPARARLRVSVQWREAHDPEYFRAEDYYLRPLADVRLVILRQRDPSGTRLPADDFDVIAYSDGLPQRLDNQPNTATYEQTVEFTADPAGRYAVRVEGRAPTGIRPPEVPSLADQQTSWELRPRLFVDTIDPRSRAAGRPVFRDYVTALGSIGIPSDAHGVIAVGAAGLSGKLEPDSSRGAPYNADLLTKPDVLAYDAMGVAAGGRQAYGSSIAAAFAAGSAAAAISGGASPAQLNRGIWLQPGRMLRLP